MFVIFDSAYQVFVEDFMVKDVIFLSLTSTYHQIQNQLNRYKYRSFPLVESKGDYIVIYCPVIIENETAKYLIIFTFSHISLLHVVPICCH